MVRLAQRVGLLTQGVLELSNFGAAATSWSTFRKITDAPSCPPSSEIGAAAARNQTSAPSGRR